MQTPTYLAHDRLCRALARRRGQPIGTPLQARYQRTYTSPTETTATTFWGARMHVILPELVSCEIHRYGVIEPGLTALMIAVVDPDAVVYDVGAHLGYYSLLAAFLGARVHAFEPSRSTLPLLERNVGNRAVVRRLGLWSRDTTLDFNDFGDARSALSTFLVPKDGSTDEPEASYSCSVTTIDRYAEATGAVPNMIKIDAEGAEFEVLQGAVATMESARPLITVEVGDVADSGQSRRAIEFAIARGYAAFDMAADGTRPHEIQDTYTYDNVLLAPQGFDPRQHHPYAP